MPFNIKFKKILLSFAVLELLFCGFYINREGFKEKLNSHVLKTNPINKDLVIYENYIEKPLVYSSGKLSYSCYEPAANGIAKTLNLFIGQNVNDLKADFFGNQITIHSTGPISDKFVLNYGWNGGWSCNNCKVYENEGIIEVDPEEAKKEITIFYDPFHLQLSLAFYFIGLFLLVFAFRSSRK